MDNQFTRLENIFQIEGLETLKKSHIAIFGIGGVGSYIAEGLVRSGIGEISIIDNDTVSISNINRQNIALHSTINSLKVDVMKQRLLDINPNCIIHTYPMFFDEETSSKINFKSFTYVADAIDSVKSKLHLIRLCNNENIPIISCMGTGNKLDPTKLTVSTLNKTHTCPLAKKIRKELANDNISNLKVIFSTEQPSKSNIVSDTIIPSSFVSVTATAGYITVSEIIQDILHIHT